MGWDLNTVFVYCAVAARHGGIIDPYFSHTVLVKSSTDVKGL